MSAENRAPGTVWGFRVDGSEYVRTLDGDRILMYLTDVSNERAPESVCVIVSRRDARMLAKRLNQCLDRTAK